MQVNIPMCKWKKVLERCKSLLRAKVNTSESGLLPCGNETTACIYKLGMAVPPLYSWTNRICAMSLSLSSSKEDIKRKGFPDSVVRF